MAKGRRGKEMTEDQRIDAARRVLAGVSTAQEICEEMDVSAQTLKGWMSRLERKERDQIVDRFRAAAMELSWMDKAAFAEIVEQVESLTAESKRLRDAEWQRRMDERDEKIRLANLREQKRHLAVIDGGLN